MIQSIVKNIQSILFLLTALYIFFTEMLLFTIMRDYSSFINRLSLRLASINILYVKIFQAFALNNSLIDDKTNNMLMKFTDNAPWSDSDIDYNELRELSRKFGVCIEPGNEAPINAGMISLVFKAYKNENSNEKLIIKMKRKNIQQKLDEAIDNLLFSMYILSFIPIINKYQIAELVNKNIEIIRHQTNFLEEIDNMNTIRENCKNLKYVKIPVSDRKITEAFPSVIVMDFIEGNKISQINENDHDIFAKLVVKFGLVTSIIHGITHGDLHSGNILFINDNNDKKYPHKIGVIDFGIVYRLSSEYKECLFDIFTQLFEKSPHELCEKILNSIIIEPRGIIQQINKDDYNNILKFSEEILSEAINSSKNANQIQVYKFLSKLNEYLSKEELSSLGIRPSDDFVKSQLVLAMSHGVTLTLCNNDFMTLMDEVINELFHTRLLL